MGSEAGILMRVTGVVIFAVTDVGLGRADNGVTHRMRSLYANSGSSCRRSFAGEQR
jgi:hypothetical protein